MPFKSKKQEKWAFATHQKFAKKWANKTNYSKLPDKKTIKSRLKTKLIG